jgi:hypothetical protein
MARVSDQLAELSRRAQSAEAAVAAARTESRVRLTEMVEQSRDKAQRRADGLRASGNRMIKDADNKWTDIQTHWKDLVRTVRTDLQDAQSGADVARAQRRADRAEDSADLAVAFAMAALEEAEYAVLDATLARADANDAVAGVR